MRLVKFHHRAATGAVPVTLATILGGNPTTLLHADDLAETDGQIVTTWPGRTDYDGAGVGSPVVDADGWGGSRKVVSLSAASTQGIAVDDAASAYDSDTPFTWIFAGRIVAISSTHYLMALSTSSADTGYRGLACSTTQLIVGSSVGGSNEADFGTALSTGVDGIIGFTWDGTTARVARLTSSGETQHISATHTLGGSWGVNRFTVGFLNRLTTKLATSMRVRTIIELPYVATSSTDLSTALAFVRDSMDCPLS